MLHLSALIINLALCAALQDMANFFRDDTKSQFLKPDPAAARAHTADFSRII